MFPLDSSGLYLYHISNKLRSKDEINDILEFIQIQANDTSYTITKVQQKQNRKGKCIHTIHGKGKVLVNSLHIDKLNRPRIRSFDSRIKNSLTHISLSSLPTNKAKYSDEKHKSLFAVFRVVTPGF